MPAARSCPDRRGEQIALAIAGGFLVLTTFLPLARLALELAAAGPSGAAVLAGPRPWVLMVRSLTVAAATTGLALAGGVPLAMLIACSDLPGRRLALLLHGFPMFLPPVVLALGWFHLLGKTGVIGGDTSARLLFSEAGVVLVLATTFTPVVTTIVGLALQGIDASLEEAGSVVARPLRVATTILLPLARPGVALAGLVVFALALTELAVPMFLRVDLYPAAVFARLGGTEYAPGEALALALPMLGLSLAMVAVERRWVFGRSLAGLTLLRANRRALLVSKSRWVAAVLIALAAVLSVAPLVALVVRAGYTGIAETPAWIGASIRNSLLCATAAASAILAVGVVLGHGLARGRRWAAAFDSLAVLGFVVPAGVLGVGLIGLWNHPATRLVYGTVGIVVIGYVARYAVIGVRVVASAVSQTPVHLEEVAAVFGGSYGLRLRRIVIPLHARAVAGAWLLALVFSLRDLDTAVLFYPPGGETLPVRIFTLEANGPPGVVAGLALVQTLLTASVLLAATVLLRQGKRR